MITLKINPTVKNEISPYLYMQFMEPLGVADASVDAAWDFTENDWQPAVIEKVRELAPTMVRFGGCFASYYHWREAVGPRKSRVPMKNHCWGGLYHNQVGTHELMDFCKRVDAAPLLVVNMESEGLKMWQQPKNDTLRMGTDTEAADWVDYCNNPENAERIANGAKEPFSVKYWQIGNETSYGAMGQKGFNVDQCYEATGRFAEKMRWKDPSIKIIGWGDKNLKTNENWCKKMSQVDNIDMLALHHHFDSGLPDSPLYGTRYRDNYEENWPHLMNAWKSLEEHIQEMRADAGKKRLAITEGHYMLPGRNRNEVLSSWGAGVSYARCLNTIMRHSDIVDIATMADFFGNVWQVNAVMIPAPLHFDRKCYLQPVGAVMSLFRKHQGKHMLDCEYNGAIDAVASATMAASAERSVSAEKIAFAKEAAPHATSAAPVGSAVTGKIYVHVANTDMKQQQKIKLEIGGRQIAEAKMFYITENPATEITPVNMDVFDVKTQQIQGDTVILPPAAVAAIEIEIM